MKVLIIIPARYGSTRLPGKPLRAIGKMSMIERVYRQCEKTNATSITVATEDDIIEHEVTGFKGICIKTKKCDSGTERVIEVMKEYSDYDVYINVQGDEPFIDPEDINKVIDLVKEDPSKVATLVTDLEEHELMDRNTVKAITYEDEKRSLLMFTRSPLMTQNQHIMKHVGIYGFSKEVLGIISTLKAKTINEVEDNLEQLRWADEGLKFNIDHTKNPSIGIDTPEDLQRALDYYTSK